MNKLFISAFPYPGAINPDAYPPPDEAFYKRENRLFTEGKSNLSETFLPEISTSVNFHHQQNKN